MLDVAVVGGGIVGLATAHALRASRPGLRVAVLEKEDRVGAHQSGRNSGVLHSGIYYRPGSRKAETVREGRELMQRFCADHGVRFTRTGKVIVASSEAELPRLALLEARAAANGVEARRIGPAALRDLEPHVAGVAALHVPSAGLVDFPGVCRVLAEQVGDVRLGTRAVALHERGDRVVVETDRGEVEARVAVNAAGLWADRLAGSTDVRIVPFRGEYYELVTPRRHLVRGLVYPVPDPALPFLGVHFTRTLDGGVHCGPSAVLALAREGYRRRDVRPGEVPFAFAGFRCMARRWWRTGVQEVHRSVRRAAFAAALQRLVPEVTARDLLPAPAGVRAQAVDRDGNLLDDFAFGERRRVVDVLNAPSPGATASLAIGRAVAALALSRLGDA